MDMTPKDPWGTDWAEARERMEAWWQHEVIDRCVAAVTAPRSIPLREIPVPPKPKEPEVARTDVDYHLQAAEASLAKTLLAGEAFPVFWPNLGPGIVAAYLGIQPVFTDRTVWFGTMPPITNWGTRGQFCFDPDNKWWVLTKDFTRRLSRAGEGRFLVGITDMGGSLDIVASLRGTEQLLTDLVDHRDEVKKLSRETDDLWFKYYDELDAIVQEHGCGRSAWMGLWCDRTWYPLQCDFAAMISPRMFEEFVLPGLQTQAERLDYSIFHLDGEGELPHLELLLSMPRLTGIQWTPGDGAEPMDDPKWFPLYRRIQEAGKNLVILNVSPHRVGLLLSELSWEGLYMRVPCESEEEAARVMDEVGRSGSGRAARKHLV
ncbi:MAG: hypothetical protein HYY08_03775 [Firmicutes bacterium]|nr:hypothetical protein [Bacillota bacterium]